MKQKLWWISIRHFSRISPPKPAVIRVKNNVAHMGHPKLPPEPRQRLSLPQFPSHHLPSKDWGRPARVTAVSWIKYYFHEVEDCVIQSHFNKGLVTVQMGCEDMDGDSVVENGGKMKPMKKNFEEIRYYSKRDF